MSPTFKQQTSMTETVKERELSEVLKNLTDAHNLMAKAEKLGQAYTDKYCPYKKGQWLLVKPKYGQQEIIEVSIIKFDIHGFVDGCARICGRPITKDGQPKLRRSGLWIEKNNEILSVVKS